MDPKFNYGEEAEAIAQAYVKRLRKAVEGSDGLDADARQESRDELSLLVGLGIGLIEILDAMRGDAGWESGTVKDTPES